jgi:HD-like signal output (HDOD) protein
VWDKIPKEVKGTNPMEKQEQLQITNTVKKLLISQPITIPIFHEVAMRIQTLMQKEDYIIHQIISLVNEDPALASKMLYMSNSTGNTGREHITTLRTALIRLGSQQILNMVYELSIKNQTAVNPYLQEQMCLFWKHAHAVAIASSYIATIYTNKEKTDLTVDEIYLAGLLHDVGKLYLLKSMDKLANALIFPVNESTVKTSLDELHVAQGIKLMEHWSIPKIYLKVVKHHHDKICTDAGICCVRVANFLHNFVEQKREWTTEDEKLINTELDVLNLEEDIQIIIKLIRAIE